MIFPSVYGFDGEAVAPVMRWVFVPTMILLTGGVIALGFWTRKFVQWKRILSAILMWAGLPASLLAGLILLGQMLWPSTVTPSPYGLFEAACILGASSFVSGIFIKRQAIPLPLLSISTPVSNDSRLRYEEYVAYEPILARRIAAAVIDYNVFAGLSLLYLYLFGTRVDAFNYAGHGGHFFIVLLLWFSYFIVAEAIWGATLAKLLFRIRVIREDSDDAALKVAFKRHLLDCIDFFLFGVVAIVLVKVTQDHKRLGDFFAHSRVVLHRQNPVST